MFITRKFLNNSLMSQLNNDVFFDIKDKSNKNSTNKYVKDKGWLFEKLAVDVSEIKILLRNAKEDL